MTAPVTLINLTPHFVRVYRDDGTLVDIAPSGQVARVIYDYSRQTVAGGIPVQVSAVRTTKNLPHANKYHLYIVSSRVRLANPDRLDLLSPANPNRDGRYHVVSCRALERNPYPVNQRKGR